MKKIFLLPLLSVLVIFSCGNNENPEPGPEPDPPEPTPVYVDKPIRIVTTDIDGNLTDDITKEYDELYRVIKSENKHYSSGELDYDDNYQYAYNEHDDVIHYIRSSNIGAGTDLTYDYQYDKNNNIEVMTTKGEDGNEAVNYKDTYEYDEYNRITLHKYYESDDIKNKYVYTYTEGKQYKEFKKEVFYNYYYDTSEIPFRTTEQTFDEKGDLKTATVKNQGGFIETEMAYSFDNYHCMRELITLSNAKTTIKTVFSATYYKNNPDKPLETTEDNYLSETSEEPVAIKTSTYEYDTHDRLKKETVISKVSEEIKSKDITTYYYEVE